jgi:diguanylate cyclase (GGDEF)-like protein
VVKSGRTVVKTLPAWVWLTAAGIVVLQVFYVWWLIVKPGGEDALLWFGDTVYLVFPAVATVLLFLVARQFPDVRTRWAWRLLGLYALLTLSGDAMWSVYEIGLDREVPYPSVCDVAYLAAYPLAFAGLFLFPRAHVSGLRRLRLTLDTLIAMIVVATFSCYFIIGELIGSSGEYLLGDVVNIIYPIADLGLIFAVLVLIGRPGPRYLDVPLALLAAGFAVTALADSLYIYVDISGYASGDLLDLGWIAGYNLAAYAALATFALGKTASDEAALARRTVPLRALIPYVVAAPGAALLIGSQMDDKPLGFHYLVIGGATVILVLIVIRQVLSLYENAALNRALRVRADELARRNDQLRLLHRAASFLSQRLATNDVLSLSRVLISEWAGAKEVDIWQLGGRRPHLWHDSGDGVAQHQRPPLTVRADRVKLAARNASPILFRHAGDGQSRAQAAEAGSLSQEGTLYIPLGSGKHNGAVAELILSGRPSPGTSDLDLLNTLGIEVGAALERAHQFEEARELADRDFVTGLNNHRFVQGELERGLLACAQQDRPLSIVLMDIDNFRLLNEIHGHPAGDRVLKMVAGRLASVCNGEALAGRFGGDEFIALLPGVDRQEALAFARSIQEWADAQDLQVHEAQRIPLSMSYGVASYPDHGGSRQELLAAADANLYESSCWVADCRPLSGRAGAAVWAPSVFWRAWSRPWTTRTTTPTLWRERDRLCPAAGRGAWLLRGRPRCPTHRRPSARRRQDLHPRPHPPQARRSH